MKRFRVLSLVAVLALILASCSPAASTTSSSVSSSASSSGSESVLYMTTQVGDPTDKFAHLWTNRGSIYQILTFRSLFLANSELSEFKPDLASGFKVSPDGLTIEVTLKDNLKWSDGTALTVNDVVFSVKTALKAAVINGIYTGAFNKIVGAAEWKAGTANDLTGLTSSGNLVTFKLSSPVGNFIDILAQFAIYPQHKLGSADPLTIHNNSFWEAPVSNGMYKVTEYVPNQFFVLEINENFEGTKPKIQKVQVTVIADPVTAAQTGKLDYFDTNVPSQINELNKISGFKANPVDILFFRYLVVNIKNPNGFVNNKMNDYRVRQAMLLAIDRKALQEGLYPGLAAISNSGVPTAYAAYNPSNDPFSYNPTKAKELLTAAGFNFNETLKIRYYHRDQTSIDFITAVGFYLGEVGIKTDIALFQGDPTTELYQVRDYDIALKNLGAFAYEEWYGEYASSNTNFAQILGGDTIFDNLNNRLSESTDPVIRDGLLSGMQTLEQSLLYKLPLLTLKNVIYINTNNINVPSTVTFGNPRFNYDLDFANWTVKSN